MRCLHRPLNGIKGTIFVRVLRAKGWLFQLQFARRGDAKAAPAAYTGVRAVAEGPLTAGVPTPSSGR